MTFQVSLYSMGFSNAKQLAAQIVQTFKLCSELLSEQPHYEYGMRAVKAVITAAAHYRQVHAEEEDEFRIVLKALISVNLPKFIADDVPLFKGILRDLFPLVEESLSSEGTKELLAKAIKEKCVECNLQPTKWFVEKVCSSELILCCLLSMLYRDHLLFADPSVVRNGPHPHGNHADRRPNELQNSVFLYPCRSFDVVVGANALSTRCRISNLLKSH